jgi:hypothetical protein
MMTEIRAPLKASEVNALDLEVSDGCGHTKSIAGVASFDRF